MKTLIVIPCYNEAKRLRGEVFSAYCAEHPDTDFLFANDGSTDNTLQVLNELAVGSERMHVLDLQPNGGKAEAVRRGMLHAAEYTDAQYIGFWDADLATPLDEMPDFVKWADLGYDMVTGLRLKRLGAKVERKPTRHYMGRVFATCASALLRLPVYDTQCGSKLYRRDIVPELFASSFITRWLFDVELLARYKQQYGAECARTKIYELPLYKWEDVAGSRLKGRDFIKAPVELLKIWRAYR
ncbi:MAG: glycosyltransferase family 2 protein [Bacteroidales bacterium]|nr:glycosyltransferase family 2 protein [Bacteroidales bacterium]